MKIFGIGAIGLVLLLALGALISYVSAANYGNEQTVLLETKWQDNQNVLGQYTLKIGEMAQVPEIARDDFKEILRTAFEGRYGTEGVDRGVDPNQKVFQWLQEQNPTMSPGQTELYNRINQAMEAGRNEFKTSQTQLLDVKRSYLTQLGYLWRGFWLRTAGYPKLNGSNMITVDGISRRVTALDIDKHYKVVVAADTLQKFETGVDSGIKLRPQAAQ